MPKKNEEIKCLNNFKLIFVLGYNSTSFPPDYWCYSNTVRQTMENN